MLRAPEAEDGTRGRAGARDATPEKGASLPQPQPVPRTHKEHAQVHAQVNAAPRQSWVDPGPAALSGNRASQDDVLANRRQQPGGRPSTAQAVVLAMQRRCCGAATARTRPPWPPSPPRLSSVDDALESRAGPPRAPLRAQPWRTGKVTRVAGDALNVQVGAIYVSGETHIV